LLCRYRQLQEAFTNLGETHALILSMRGVPRIRHLRLAGDGRLLERLKAQSSLLMLAGTHPDVLRTLEKGGLLEEIGEHNLFWSADQAIVAAEARGCVYCKSRSSQRRHPAWPAAESKSRGHKKPMGW